MAAPEFSVFVSYKSSDREQIRPIVAALKARNLKVWFDDDEIPPGRKFLPSIDQGLKSSRSVAVFIGPDGVGPYHAEEAWVAVQAAIESGRPCIPVLLPGTPDSVEKNLPALLRTTRLLRLKAGDEFAEGIDWLLWGITGNPLDRPRQRTPGDQPEAGKRVSPMRRMPSADERLEEAAEELAGVIHRPANVTFFLGPRFSPTSPDLPPRPCEIARDLLVDLNLVDRNYDQLLPSIDTAASYYAARWGTTGLEARVRSLIEGRSRSIPAVHARLAEILHHLQGSPISKRRKRFGPKPQLVVSTSLDTLLERAMLAAGVSFTRIVQHRSGARITINEYKDVRVEKGIVSVAPTRRKDATGGDRPAVNLAEIESLDELIATSGEQTVGLASPAGAADTGHPLRQLTLDAFTEPFVYKYHGSQDVPGSCALDAKDYLRLALRPAVPDKIVEIISNSAALFVGCGPFDADVRHLYETLLRRAYEVSPESLPRFAILPAPGDEVGDNYRRMEASVWPGARNSILKETSIDVLDGSSEAFLGMLSERVLRSPGART